MPHNRQTRSLQTNAGEKADYTGERAYTAFTKKHRAFSRLPALAGSRLSSGWTEIGESSVYPDESRGPFRGLSRSPIPSGSRLSSGWTENGESSVCPDESRGPFRALSRLPIPSGSRLSSGWTEIGESSVYPDESRGPFRAEEYIVGLFRLPCAFSSPPSSLRPSSW